MNRQQQFEEWLEPMALLLGEFLRSLPAEVSAELDYSIESLDALEAWLLDKYPTYEALRDDPDVTAWDGATRYFGEVLVKQLGGYWDCSAEGLPRVRDVADDVAELIPMYMVSSVADRRTGHHLRTIAEANRDAV